MGLRERPWVLALSVTVIVVVVMVAGLWATGQFRSTTSTTPQPPLPSFTLLPQGTRMTVPAPGYLVEGPYDFTNTSQWNVSGAWWETNGTDMCIASTGYFSQWNRTSEPRNCDGFGFYGSPNIGGWQQFPGGWGFRAGHYLLLWYNLGGKVPVQLNVTVDISAHPIGSPCTQSPPPEGC